MGGSEHENNGKTHVTYELVSDGTALLQGDTSEKIPAMVTIYHVDGDRLLLTHVDPNRLITEWRFCKNGRPKSTERAHDTTVR